jgi:hypothetical protein
LRQISISLIKWLKWDGINWVIEITFTYCFTLKSVVVPISC